jgi:hypothetical protein
MHPQAAITAIKALRPVRVMPRPPAPEGVDPEQADLDRRIQAVALERAIDYAAAFRSRAERTLRTADDDTVT